MVKEKLHYPKAMHLQPMLMENLMLMENPKVMERR
jgi:hypothetical protein